MEKLTYGTNMINLANTLTVLERNNDGTISSLMLINKEAAESYADYWEEQEEKQLLEPEIFSLDSLMNLLKGKR